MKLRKQVKNLDSVFSPKSIAVIGAAREPNRMQPFIAIGARVGE